MFLKFSNDVKIDIDGIEGQKFKGAQSTLFNKRMKPILIRLDTNYSDESGQIIQVIEQAGFTLEAKDHTPQFANIYLGNKS